MANTASYERPNRKARRKRTFDGAGVEQVSGYKLAAHLGLTRQGVDALTAQGVLTRGADGLFNMTQNRLAFIAHLKAARRSTAQLSAQAEHHKQKARLLELRVQTEEGLLMKVETHNHLTDTAIGVILTELSSWPVLIAGPDHPALRKRPKACSWTYAARSQGFSISSPTQPASSLWKLARVDRVHWAAGSTWTSSAPHVSW